MKKICLMIVAACAAGFILAAAGVEKAPDALKVVFYCDRGVGVDLVGRLMDDCPEFIVTFASGKEIGEGALNGADMVVHSGGGGGLPQHPLARDSFQGRSVGFCACAWSGAGRRGAD